MNIKRKLASIQEVHEIRDIAGKDNIALAKINGWQAIVRKADVRVGDKVVFFEPDALLPELPAFEFMRKNNFRVSKTKMGGVVSEGLIMPLKDVFGEGYDLTDQLGVKHFEERIHESSKFNADSDCWTTFPNSVPKTDAIRIQNYQELLNHDSKYFAHRYSVTEKLDGTSMTVIVGTPKEIGMPISHDEARIFVCSRNFVKKKSKKCDFWNMVTAINLDERLLRCYNKEGRALAIQGEIIGPGIQKNRYRLKERKFMVFAIYDIRERLYVDLWGPDTPHPSEWSFTKEHFDNLEFVPFIGNLQIPSHYFNEFKPVGPDVEESGNETVEELVRQKKEDCDTFVGMIKAYANDKCKYSNLNSDVKPEGIILTDSVGDSIKYIY